MVVERPRPHLKLLILQQHVVTQRDLGQRLALETVPSPKLRTLHASLAQLMHQNREVGGVTFNQIPRVRVQLVLDLIDEVARPVQAYANVATEADAQQMIEAGEVIHVRMRYEHVADAQQLARRHVGDIADVEQHGATLELEIDVEPRVAEDPIYELGVIDRTHALSKPRVCFDPGDVRVHPALHKLLRAAACDLA